MGLKDKVIEIIDNNFSWLIRDPSVFTGDNVPYQLTSEDYKRLLDRRNRDAKYLGNMACEGENTTTIEGN